MPQSPETLTDPAPAAESAVIAAPIGPVQESERYVLMDVVRGFALFGVLAANMRSFNLPMLVYETPEKFFPGRADVWAQALLSIFISAKFYTLFAFLFGLGFAIQMTRADARTAGRFPWFYLRRLAALACFGLIHGLLIWNGDILMAYAIGGFWLLWFRRSNIKTIGRWIYGMWGGLLVILTVAWVAQRRHWHINISGGGRNVVNLDHARQIIGVYQHSHLFGEVRETALLWTNSHPPSRLHPWLWLTATPLQDLALGTISVATFLLGLYVWRKGVLQNLQDWRPQIKRICAVTLPLGVAMNAVLEIADHLWPQHATATLLDLPRDWCSAYSVPILSCGYATLLAVLFLSERWRPRVQWLAPMGRMALTNYLMQSIVCVAFYSGFVTGLYGRIGPAWDFVATLVLYFAQVAFSHWWLARFRFGPMEWLWRSLTYGKRPAMRLASSNR